MPSPQLVGSPQDPSADRSEVPVGEAAQARQKRASGSENEGCSACVRLHPVIFRTDKYSDRAVTPIEVSRALATVRKIVEVSRGFMRSIETTAVLSFSST